MSGLGCLLARTRGGTQAQVRGYDGTVRPG
jgi:hypothetical protein